MILPLSYFGGESQQYRQVAGRSRREDNCESRLSVKALTTPTRKELTTNKRTAIKNTLARSGLHATPKQVVGALRQLGIEVSERFVAQVRLQMFRDEAKAMRERSKRPPKTMDRIRPQQRKVPPRRG
jgi:hypothetical protein